MKQRLTALILVLALLASLASCSAKNPETEDQTQTSAGDSAEIQTADVSETPAEPEETAIPLGIPEEDNGGRDFHMLVPNEKAYEFVTEATGEVVNDAIFERSNKTADLFNISFSYQYEPGGWDDRDSYNNFVKNAVLAGDSTYDIATGFIVCSLPLYLQGSLMDFMTVADLNLSNPWWMNGQYDDLNIDGHLFCVFGDANLSVYKDCSVVYFNKQVLTDFGLENPYDLVREGTWTMPKFLSMAEQVVVDLNGDTKIDPETDAIGAYAQGVPIRAFQTAMDVKVIDTDEEGNRVEVGLTERLVQAHDWATNFLRTDVDSLYGEMGAVDNYQFCHILAENRSLFHCSYIYIIEGDVMRNMEADFGIVPYPKFDEQQARYKTQIGTSSNVMFLTKTTSDPNLSCRVMEALNYYSMLDVIPTYYTVALENKYTRDKDVPEMLALIREGMTMDFAFAYSTCFNGQWPNTLMVTGEGDLASKMKGWEKMWKKDLERLAKIPE